VDRLYAGTSGYAYAEWVAAGVYPAGTHAAGMLPAYAEMFKATELNYTWYQMPKARSLERMAAQVPRGFKFSVKLTRTMTHEVDKAGWIREVLTFRQGIAPLEAASCLLCILVQLPPYFSRTPERRIYLAALLDELSGLPVAVEFRHSSWVHDKVFYEFERRAVTLVAVDGPDLPGLFPRLDIVTNPRLFYLRLHGRNTQGWGSGNMQKQFDYNYSDAELKSLAGTISNTFAPAADIGAVFFNNHVRGQAPNNCRRLINILRSRS
jgi:uncharacterized protein YecE (DUF72 family)